MRRLLLCMVVCAVVLPCSVQGQHQMPDSAVTANGPRPIPSVEPSSDSLPHGTDRTKSPGMAMLYSAILPGAGQAYNESWWKVPIVTGLGIYFLGSFLHNDRLATEYREKYEQSLLENPYGDPRLLAQRDFYKAQRDSFAWYFLILYVLNIVDAYVDASLYNFDVSPALSLRVLPHGGRWEVQLQF